MNCAICEDTGWTAMANSELEISTDSEAFRETVPIQVRVRCQCWYVGKVQTKRYGNTVWVEGEACASCGQLNVPGEACSRCRTGTS